MTTAWKPEPIWDGQDAYIIGGGPSLKSFNWDLLRGRNTIGCNSAYLLGPAICKVCFFGDHKFFLKYQTELQEFQGLVVTNCRRFLTKPVPWLKAMHRRPRGLALGDTLGWNFSSGAAAINLALLFGAARVFLLGIDLRSEEGQHNWHDRQPDHLTPQTYQRFQRGFQCVADDLPKLFPGRQVISISDEDHLGLFPVRSVVEHFGEPIHVNPLQGSTETGRA